MRILLGFVLKKILILRSLKVSMQLQVRLAVRKAAAEPARLFALRTESLRNLML